MVHKRKKNGVNPFSQYFLVSKALVKPVEKKIWKRNPHHILVRTRSNKLCSFYVSIYQISTYRTICLSVSTRISCFCFTATSSEDFHLLCRIATTKVGKIRLTAKLFRRNLADSSNFSCLWCIFKLFHISHSFLFIICRKSKEKICQK